MKVLLINGSPRLKENSSITIDEMVKIFNKQDIETEVICIGNKNIRGCIGCGKCVFDDIVNEIAPKFEEAD